MSKVKASVSQIQISPQKVSVVASLIRGRNIEDALIILEHTPRRAARPITKVLESAKANAENNHGLSIKDLKISSIDIGQGPSMKRYRPTAHGRAQPYKKRTTNIRIEVEGTKKPSKKNKTQSKSKSEAKKSDKSQETKKESK